MQFSQPEHPENDHRYPLTPSSAKPVGPRSPDTRLLDSAPIDAEIASLPGLVVKDCGHPKTSWCACRKYRDPRGDSK